MTFDVSAIVDRARVAAQQPSADKTGGNDRQRLERIAQEFESMLLVQVLKDMRKAGDWDGDENESDTFGAESMFETLDSELAQHLAKIKGLGLSKELLAAFDRMNIVPSEGRLKGPEPLAMPEPPAALAIPVGPTHASPLPGSHGHEVPVAPPAEPALTTPAGEVTSSFGWRTDPFTGQAKFHKGVDLRAAYGQDVIAAADGRIVFSGQQGGYGTTVVIEHANGTRTRYAHLSVALGAQGDEVAAGQPIGRAGRSGRATGTHLHFEVTDAAGRPLDPRMAGQLTRS